MPDLPLPDDATCLACRYALRQLTVNRCPECGRPFNPANPASFRSDSRRRAFYRRRAGKKPIVGFAVTAVVVALFLPLWLEIIRGEFTQEIRLAAIGMAVMTGLVVRSYLREWNAGGTWPEERPIQRRARRWLITTIATVLILSSVSAWSCPHGSAFQFGPFVVTYTGRDGMCRSHGALGHRYQLSEHVSFYVCYRRYY